MNKITLGILLVSTCLGAAACSTGPRPHGGEGTAAPASQERDTKWREALSKPPLAVTTAFDENGRLWQAHIRDRHLYVSHSDDRGKSFSRPIMVNPEPEHIAGDGENRPKIVARNRTVYVSYTQALEKPMAGYIRFSRSVDGGNTFSRPVTINDDLEVISHRFEAMGVNERGRVFLAWLDKRDLQAAGKQGKKYAGVAVYYAVSDDGGASFRPNIKVADHSCECCRVAMAMDVDGTPVILWRHIFGKNTRDHALLRLDGRSALVRASEDGWEIDACPHHGPSLSIADDGVYHLAWYTGAEGRAGLYYRRSRDHGKTFTAPIPFGNRNAQPARPQVLSLGTRVFLAWKEFDGTGTAVRWMRSSDGGATWSAPATVATAAGASDHPLLASDGVRAYLSWYAAKEGHRLIELEAAP